MGNGKQYVVICQDYDDVNDKHEWYLTTRRVYTEAEAAAYMETINPSRWPRMVPLEAFIEMLPRGVQVHPNKEVR